MVELYQRETARLMEEFDSKQAAAMQKNNLSAEDINAFFRVAHTIKSSAAMMGLADISSCTHKMEDYLLIFRDDSKLAQGFESRIFDLMYQFSDYVENENDRVSQEDFLPESADQIIAAIQAEIDYFTGGAAVSGSDEIQAAEELPEPAVQEEEIEAEIITDDGGDFIWRVTMRPNCQMENVRAFMLVRRLEDLCSKIVTRPLNLESPDAAAQIVKEGLVLTLCTTREQEALQQLSSSPYVLEVEDISGGETAKKPDSRGSETADASDKENVQSRQNKYSMIAWQHIMKIQNIIGELITANTMLGAAINEIDGGSAMKNEFQTMKRLFHELEKIVATVSMMPVSSVTPQYQRIIRDIAVREGKQIRLRVSGGELEVDRNILDALSNPIIHLLRNAADHGIEDEDVRIAAGKDPCGTITLKFRNMADSLLVTVEDDGCGMDPDRLLKKAAERGVLTKDESQYTADEILELAFLPGLSTNEQTNQYSGRGVGMDVVQNVVSSLGGTVSVSSTPGSGSSVIMDVPVSMTSSECIRFAAGPYTCLIPIQPIVRIYSMQEAENNMQTIDGRMWFQADEMLPVVDLFAVFETEMAENNARIIYIKDAKGSAALLTGPVTGRQTAVEKPLPPLLGHIYRKNTGIVGCTITETGTLGIMLSTDWLIQMGRKGKSTNGN